MIRFFIVALIALLASAFPTMADEIAVTGGLVRGQTLADGSVVYRGIPYAAPPAGANRWRAPQPVVPWSGVRDTTRAPAPCIQHDEGWNAPLAAIGREDCLYISLHAPKHEPGARLPVMVWIHGGSNWAGSSYEFVDSALHTRGVVVASIEYRLGVFGFLASPGLSAESPDRTSGNLGLRDQIAALEWVKANIAAFGGDPGNVTIFGQSAGGFDVWMLMLSPKARGLFAKTILQSAVLGLPVRTRADNELIGTDFTRLMGVTDDAAGWTTLRGAPAEALVAAGNNLKPVSGIDPSMMWYQPSIDDFVLPRPPAEILARHEQAPVPLLIGDVIREFPPEGTAEQAREMIGLYHPDRAAEALRLYGLDTESPPPPDPFYGDVAAQVGADAIIRCPSNRMAEAHARAGHSVWRYQLGVAAPGSVKPAEHNADLKYVFDSAPPGAAIWPPLQQYWANFASNGDPNATGLPHWPSMGATRTYIAFLPEGTKLGNDLRGSFCRLLDSH